MADENPPIIMTEFGPVTETARRQAVLNLRRDPKKLAEMIARFGEEQIRRNYPEIYLEPDEKK
jgi:hypothetical protein